MNEIKTIKQVGITFDEGETTTFLLKDRGDGYGDRRYAVDGFDWDAERTEQEYSANIEVSDDFAKILAFFDGRTINNSIYECDKVEVIIENGVLTVLGKAEKKAESTQSAQDALNSIATHLEAANALLNHLLPAPETDALQEAVNAAQDAAGWCDNAITA